MSSQNNTLEIPKGIEKIIEEFRRNAETVSDCLGKLAEALKGTLSNLNLPNTTQSNSTGINSEKSNNNYDDSFKGVLKFSKKSLSIGDEAQKTKSYEQRLIAAGAPKELVTSDEFKNVIHTISSNTGLKREDLYNAAGQLSKTGTYDNPEILTILEGSAYIAELTQSSVDSIATVLNTYFSSYGVKGTEEISKSSSDLFAYSGLSSMKFSDFAGSAATTGANSSGMWSEYSKAEKQEQILQLTLMSETFAGNTPTLNNKYVQETNSILSKMLKQNMSKDQADLAKEIGLIVNGKNRLKNYDENGNVIGDKSLVEIEKVLEDVRETNTAGFNQFLNLVGGSSESGKLVIDAIADKEGVKNISDIAQSAEKNKSNSINQKIDILNDSSLAQLGALNAHLSEFKNILGESMEEPTKTALANINDVLSNTIKLFREYPDVAKFFTAISVGGASILGVSGSLMALEFGGKVVKREFGVISNFITNKDGKVMSGVNKVGNKLIRGGKWLGNTKLINNKATKDIWKRINIINFHNKKIFKKINAFWNEFLPIIIEYFKVKHKIKNKIKGSVVKMFKFKNIRIALDG